MTFKTYEINVDLVHDTSTTYSNHFSQNDRNSAKLLVTITNKGAELDLSQAKSVRMSFRKPDGTRVFQNDCQPINAMKGKYQIVLKTQTLTSVGNVIAQIHIEEEDRILDTQKFFFVVNDSLASDEAVESTNEFTIIQKAIEAGKKLEGVDINGIIAAGELAKGALPKTGGTMTGDLKFANGKSIRLQNAEDKTIMTLGSNSGGGFYSWSDVAAKGVFRYDPATHFMDIQAGTNVYKKTEIYGAFTQYDGRAHNINGQDLNNLVQAGQYSGQNLLNTPEGAAATTRYYYVEVVKHLSTNYAKQIATTLSTTTPTSWIRTMNNGVWGNWIPQIDANGGTMTGDLVMATDKNIIFSSDDYLLKIRGQKGNSKVVAQVFRPDGTSEFIGEYRGDLNRLTINCDTNLVKKTGDPITGELTMRGSGARLVIDEGGQSVTIDQPTSQTSARGFLYRENGATLGGIGRIRSTTDAYNYIGWGANPWDSASALIVSDKVLKYKNKDVAMRDKDDRATIPVTADAELITSYGVIADRRGNTVTLRAPIRRKVGSTNGHVFTLPPGMRPTMMLTQVVHASDGTPALMTIPSDTGQVLLQTITPAIMGKDYHIVLTYVAD
ncbi:BppU family phage baseplate upper protein [Bacillus paranthracis]|uniref:BppU family phage baseplate upper protein n=3 Tax=Bacillus paranthracis TaxID=2026186 RepID=UPI0007B2826D|nr:hypothetical protein B4085_1529 [Bacillus cereus]KZD58779.1 hypothetical protein B4116_4029 [Bacillus cereus]